jgi:hypothetical protein
LKELGFWSILATTFSFAIAEILWELSVRRVCLWANLVLAAEEIFTFVAASLLDTAALSLINPATPTAVAPASAISIAHTAVLIFI